jgi:hypothetical protein
LSLGSSWEPFLVVLLCIGAAAANLSDELQRIEAASLGRRTLKTSFDLAFGVGFAKLGAKFFRDGDFAAFSDDDVAVRVGSSTTKVSHYGSLAILGSACIAPPF